MELMVGMAVGMLVLLAVTTIYINVLRTSATTLDATRLNQDVSAIMNIMANDIRRAGYWGGAAVNFTNPFLNPFTRVETVANADISALRVHANVAVGSDAYEDVTYNGPGFITLASAGSCVTYTYDANNNGTLEDNEEFGFRWDGWSDRATYDASTKEGLLLMRTSNNDTGANGCSDGDGNWLAINEFSRDVVDGVSIFRDGIIITNLRFDISSSRCLNASEPDGTDDDADGNDADEALNPEEYDCYAVVPTPGATPGDGSGNSTVESIVVNITLTAELADDSSVRVNQTQSVELRNNLIRAR